ncbi:MAG: DUF624 domain-containing protein [Ruminococcaceae bacterium]|nr:DUF624 domain-containing protein [Oscillospiraceae bacterium]
MDFISGRGAKFYEFCTKMYELMWLNVLVFVTSLPIVTIGASFSAMHYVLVKIYRDEEEKITKDFFKSFGKNFLQATLIWLIYLAIFGFLLTLDYIRRLLQNPTLEYLKLLVPVLAFIAILSLCWVFVLQSRYKLSIKDIFAFSFTRIIAFPIRTIFMALTLILPVVFVCIAPGLAIIAVLLGISVPGILSTCFYNKALEVMEDDSAKEQPETPQEEEPSDEQEDNLE